MTGSPEDKDFKYNVYLDERKRNIESKAKQSENFDKYILTLSAGALGLSLTFINQFDKLTNCNTKPLEISWVSFALSIVFTLLSFKVSHYTFSKLIELLDSNYKDNKRERLPKSYNLITEFLNYSSLLAFIVGVIYLIIFTLTNLKGVIK